MSLTTASAASCCVFSSAMRWSRASSLSSFLLLQETQGLRPAFEVELFRPTLIADALTCGNVRLNVNQLSDLIRFLFAAGLDDGGKLDVLGEGGQHLLLLKLLVQLLGGDELYPVRWAIA